MADAWMPILVPTDKYKYTSIKDIKIGAVQNVYGIVQSVNGPSVTKSGLDMMTLRLIDDSCIEEVNGEETYKFLPCVLYGSVRIDLPQVDVGDIVRFHRLVVKNYQGLAQGKMAAGFSWLVASGKNIKHSHDSVTYTSEDSKRMKELTIWKESHAALFETSTEITRLSNIEHKHYWINLGVQVVDVYQSDSDSTCAIIIGWDGTMPTFNSYLYCKYKEQSHESVDDLVMTSYGRTIKIHCFDNHRDDAMKLKSGQFVQLVNVHIKVVNRALAESSAIASLVDRQGEKDNAIWLSAVLHQGCSNGRKIIVLNESQSECNEIKEAISEITCNRYLVDHIRKNAELTDTFLALDKCEKFWEANSELKDWFSETRLSL